MKTEALYTLGESTIVYDPSVPCMIATHVGFQTSEEFRTFLNKGLELMIEKIKEKGTMAWLPNIRNFDALDERDLQWAAADWNERAYLAGIKHVAFVLADDDYDLATIGAETYVEAGQSQKEKPQMTTRMFKDEESAKAWLREVLNS